MIVVSVYSYLDYRRFLQDRLAGVKSSAFLKLVMDKKRNLARDGIESVAKGFGLSAKEKRYFELLVAFNQATTNEEKDRYFREIIGNKKFITAKPLAARQFQLFSHWYYAAVLEAVRIESPGPRNANWLQKMIHPAVSIKQIKRAATDLKRLGLLEERRNGELRRLDPMITTEDEVRSISVANFHVQMSQLAARAVMKEDAADREFSALTVAVSKEDFQKAKSEIQKFRRKLHSILEKNGGGAKDRVAHLNIQLFKITKPEKLR
jgi:uncharacterized protein (TIGR02147 family)